MTHSPPRRRQRVRGYHHGDLRNALLRAAEDILEREGIAALTLRAAARRAGVSHAAPAHHFGDLTGLLSELAAVGFARLSARFRAAMDEAGCAPDPRLAAMGRAYVGFARDHPGLFVLMFRGERLDMTRPALREAADAASMALRRAVTARAPAADTPMQAIAQAAALWSLVHGFAMLLIDGRLGGLLGALPAGTGIDRLLDEVLAVTSIGRPEAASPAAMPPSPDARSG